MEILKTLIEGEFTANPNGRAIPISFDSAASPVACRGGDCLQGYYRSNQGIERCPEWDAAPYLSRCPIRAQEWGRTLAKARIGARYHACTPPAIVPARVPPHLAGPMEGIMGYRDHIAHLIPQGIGLILKGPTGTLKTSAAVSCLMQALALGFGGLFLPTAGLLDEIFTLKTVNPEEWVRFEKRLKETDLLVLDDLGDEAAEGWVLTKVQAILSERYNHRRATLITTNLTTSELKGRYAGKIIDRLRETSQIITLKGASLRQPPGEKGDA